MDDEAVSPIIGVILMVAITVVLAVVVFYVASSVGEKTEEAPDVAFRKNAADRSVLVVKSSPNTEWLQELDLGGTCVATATLNGVAWPPPAGTPVLAGDLIAGCVAGDTLTIIATRPNQLVFETTFA